MIAFSVEKGGTERQKQTDNIYLEYIYQKNRYC